MRKIFFVLLLIILKTGLFAQTYTNGITSTGTAPSNTVKLGGTLTENTNIDLGASYIFNLKKSTAPSYLTVLNNGNVGIGVTTPGVALDLAGNTKFFDAAGANNGASFNFYSGANTITAAFGAPISVSGLTANEYSGALRFTGQDVAWGDFAYYPNGGGAGNAGNFRFSRTQSVLGYAPSGKLGVGELYSVSNIGIGTMSPLAPLQVTVAPGASTATQINVTGIDYTYDPGRATGVTAIPATIGIDQSNGISYLNDGDIVTTAYVSNQKLLWSGNATSAYRTFRLAGTESNTANYSLSLSTTSAAATDPNHYWISKPSSSSIVSYNRSLNIGTWAGGGVRIFGDGYLAPNKVADIFAGDAGVGINTEYPTEKLTVNGNISTNGKILINQANDAGAAPYALAVNGTAIFTKAIVKLHGSWPDYVFSNDYKLPALKDVESFLKQHNHLPDMPSADDIKTNGIDLGNQQGMLLKKVEELTLYVIELDKRSEATVKENELLNKKIELVTKENELLNKRIEALKQQ